MSIAGRAAKAMYDSSSAVLNKIFHREDEVIALPESSDTQKERDTSYVESLKLENFETNDKNFDAKQARENLLLVHTFDNKNRDTIDETTLERGSR